MVDKTKLRALAIDNRNSNSDLKLTDKQWTVYFFLLSKSKWNREEMHRFVYKNSFEVAKACKMLGLARSTLYSAIKTLRKYGIIIPFDDYYIISNVNDNFADIKAYVLFCLLSLRKYVGIDLLRVYLLLKRLQDIDERKTRTFTRRNLIEMLGHSQTTQQNYLIVDMYLQTLEDWELIKIQRKKKMTPFGNINLYILDEVKTDSKLLETLNSEIMIEIKLDKDYEGIPIETKSKLRLLADTLKMGVE